MTVNQAQVGGPPPPPNYISGPKKAGLWVVMVGIAVGAWVFLPMLNTRHAVEQPTGKSDIMTGHQLVTAKEPPTPQPHVAPDDRQPQGQQRNTEQVAEGYGPVNIEITDKTGSSSGAQALEGGAGEPGRGPAGARGERGEHAGSGTIDDDDLASSLHPSRRGGTTVAHMMKHRKFTVPMGTMIPCILDTAVNSQLKGNVRCHVTKDGATGQDQTVTLIDPGAWIFGEAKFAPRLHQSRILILWTHGQNPDGAEFDLSSLASDELGRPGVVGGLETFFWEKFGASVAYSLIEVAPQLLNTALQSINKNQNNSGGTNFYETSTFLAPQQALTGTVLQDILRMPPEITLNQGAFFHVMLNENIYFPMYDIQLTNWKGQP